MRILLIAGGYPPEIGGVQTSAQQVARELRRRGHRVMIITPRDGKRPRQYVWERARVVRISFAGPHSRYFLGFLLRGAIPCALIHWLYRPNAVYVTFLSQDYAVDLSLLLRFRGSARFVLSLHGADVHTYPRRSRILRFALKQLCASSDAVVACSTSLLHDLQEYLPSQRPRIAVLRNGIDPRDFEVPAVLPEHHRPYLFAAGRFVKHKGFHILLQALPLVLEAYPTLDLLIAGDGQEAEYLYSVVATLGLSDRVVFLGPLPNQAVIHRMMECELFVLPSLVEPLGIVCQEAMAAGKAVVATRVGGVPEVVVDGRTGSLVPPNDPGALAQAIVTLLKNPELRERMGTAGRRRAIHEFTWARYVDSLLPLLGSEQEAAAS